MTARMVAATAGAGVVALGLLWLRAELHPTGSAPDPVVSALQQRRSEFLRNHADVAGVLAAVASHQALLEIMNPTSTTVVVTGLDVFPRYRDLDNIGNDLERPSPEQRALAIVDYVQRHTAKLQPLYESVELHDPLPYLSTYGSGLCGDMAVATGKIARRHGLEARTVYLTGHVVAELRWVGSPWLLFDPYGPGVVRDRGRILSTAEVLARAAAGRLGEYDRLYNQGGLREVSELSDDRLPVEPFLELRARERRVFLGRAFVLASDGMNLEQILTRAKTLNTYFDGVVANSVRQLPLDGVELDPASRELALVDYFPFTAVLVKAACIPGAGETLAAPAIRGATVVASGDGRLPLGWRVPPGLEELWFPAELMSVDPDGTLYWDLSSGLGHVCPYPTRAVHIAGLEPILNACNRVELITVHTYCRANMSLSTESLQSLSGAGLEVTRPG